MTITLKRRGFLAGLLATPWLGKDARQARAEDGLPPAPRLDIHIHLFGVGDNASGCRLAKTITEAPTFQFLTKVLRLRERAKTLDEGYVLALAEQLQQSGLQKGLILAQDAVYDANGEPNWDKTSFYIPNDYLFAVVAKYPQTMLPCVSINPDRKDAFDELERCVTKGARVLKIHPPIQGVDLADKKHGKFFERCAALGVVVMVHTGHEHSAPIVDVALASPKKLQRALDLGCTVVACHCGTGRSDDRPDMLPDFLALVRKYKNLWGDTSVLAGYGRSRDFLRLLADEPARERLLHGSDFPFPAVPLAFAEKIGKAKALGLQTMSDFLAQDLALKQALGIGHQSAERAHRLLRAKPADDTKERRHDD